ncbi:MMPL family transporter [uncultured Microbacterium sp.]|uniref:MMPL family transporter n=1 Tax=uncultured Microbacterium sp. TaxID=191216 RepID=UPI0026257F0D|nr:MMPL family transporter [uncultured Microbacterium sp.]
MSTLSQSLSRVLTSRRGAWLSLAFGVLALVALFGLFGQAEMTATAQSAPPDSESARVAVVAEDFPDADNRTVIVVASSANDGQLSQGESEGVAALGDDLSAVEGAEVLGPFPSGDGIAQVIQLTAPVDGDDSAADRALVENVRDVVADHDIDGVEVQVTGGPAFGADVASAFDGADFTLLLVTIAIVAVLLIFTYRSPVLWLIPLAVVGFADQAASKATAALGSAMGLQFDTGIVSVLVFGAGTNYALLMISRYREQLFVDEDHRNALAVAWRATVPAILASNVTVVLSLLTLVLAVIPGTRGLGVACAVGLVIALAAVLLVLPPVLAVCGRGVFWPFVPRPGDTTARQGRVWRRVATRVVRRPWLPLAGGLALLGVMSAGLLGASVGLSQVEKFRVPSESAVGLEVLGAHFDAGQAQPFVIVAAAAQSQAVQDAAASVDGVVRVTESATSTGGSLVRLSVVGEPAPGTAESRELVTELRSAVHAVPDADAIVGGQGAMDVDARDGNLRDFLLVAPLILLVTLLVLIVLLRAVVAPLILLAVNTLSAVAAIGAGAWLGRTLFGWNALDLQVPLPAFLFLVALGVDYTIFLVHRARSEALTSGTRAGMVTALATTGGVITSAGIVLAGVFAALGLLPLVTLGQIGLIVGVGVLVDTLVVRTLVVPALFSLVGDRMWWPGRLPAFRSRGGTGESDHVEEAVSPVAR